MTLICVEQKNLGGKDGCVGVDSASEVLSYIRAVETHRVDPVLSPDTPACSSVRHGGVEGEELVSGDDGSSAVPRADSQPGEVCAVGTSVDAQDSPIPTTDSRIAAKLVAKQCNTPGVVGAEESVEGSTDSVPPTLDLDPPGTPDNNLGTLDKRGRLDSNSRIDLASAKQAQEKETAEETHREMVRKTIERMRVQATQAKRVQEDDATSMHVQQKKAGSNLLEGVNSKNKAKRVVMADDDELEIDPSKPYHKRGPVVLTTRHRAIMYALLDGQNLKDIAASQKIGRSTLDILVRSPMFISELRKLERRVEDQITDVHKMFRACAPSAFKAIKEMVEDGPKFSQVRLAASVNMLNYGGFKPVEKSEHKHEHAHQHELNVAEAWRRRSIEIQSKNGGGNNGNGDGELIEEGETVGSMFGGNGKGNGNAEDVDAMAVSSGEDTERPHYDVEGESSLGEGEKVTDLLSS